MYRAWQTDIKAYVSHCLLSAAHNIVCHADKYWLNSQLEVWAVEFVLYCQVGHAKKSNHNTHDGLELSLHHVLMVTQSLWLLVPWKCAAWCNEIGMMNDQMELKGIYINILFGQKVRSILNWDKKYWAIPTLRALITWINDCHLPGTPPPPNFLFIYLGMYNLLFLPLDKCKMIFLGTFRCFMQVQFQLVSCKLGKSLMLSSLQSNAARTFKYLIL